MKKFGCVAGPILCVAGLALYVFAGIGSMRAHRVATIALPVGRAVQSGLITVDTKRLCSISVVANARSRIPGFAFPLRYSVFDASGHVLASAETMFRRDRAVWWSRTLINRDGWYHHEYGYEPFAVKPPGRVRVEAQLDPEAEVRRGTVEDIALILYDNASDHRKPVFAGTALFLGGVLLGGVGIVMVLNAAAQARKMTTAP